MRADLEQLVRLCREEPTRAKSALLAYDDRFGADDVWKSVRGGLFIDVGSDLRDEALVECGIHYELLAEAFTLSEHLPARWYNIANGHASLQKARQVEPTYSFDPDSTPLIEAKRYFRMALDAFKPSSQDNLVELLVNYGNCLLGLGRSVEAIEVSRRALALNPSHPMALGNLGIGLSHFASIARDLSVLEEAKQHLEGAMNACDLVKLGGPEAKAGFGLELSKIREFFTRYPTAKSAQGIMATQAKEDPYLEFCSNGDLFLSLTKSAYSDSIGLCVITALDDETTFPRLARVINEIKERFAVARLLVWEASSDIPSQPDLDEFTPYVDLSDSAVNGLRPAKLKIAFETTFNILDKAACFLNEYLRLGIAEEKISFVSMWKSGDGALRREIASRQNFHLFALYDVCRDLAKGGYFESIRLTRHVLTHRYLVVHDAPQDSWKVSLDGPAYHIGYRELFKKALELLRLVRSAIIYMVAFC